MSKRIDVKNLNVYYGDFLAVEDVNLQATLLVWIFVVRAAMIVAAWAAYMANAVWVKSRYGEAERMNFETPLTTLVWLTSVLCIALTYVTTWFVLGHYGQLPDHPEVARSECARAMAWMRPSTARLNSAGSSERDQSVWGARFSTSHP